ncbi:MAG: histone deacetylase family protein [Candidatus Dormibacteria bacterium]
MLDPRCQRHALPGHPERPERVEAIVGALDADRLLSSLSRVESRPATESELLRVHTALHVEAIEEWSAAGGGWIDEDTYLTPHSFEAALLAAGAGCLAVELSLSGESEVVMSLCRPPGRHATPDAAMGFCLFSNAAVAARHARSLDVERVAVIDFDVHHGNGTQAALYEDGSTFYLSLHQSPLYPGTGAATERGEGAGAELTLNVPLPAGTGDRDYLEALEAALLRVRGFSPDLLVVSAGYDAHREDPLAQLDLTTAAFGEIVSRLAELSAGACGGRMVLLLEGGYDLEALGASVASSLHALEGRRGG